VAAIPAVTETVGSEIRRMTPTRRELLKQIVELIEITQDLVRATEESTRASRRLREDVARLIRRSPARRSKSLARRRRAGKPVTGGADQLQRMRMTLLKGGAKTGGGDSASEAFRGSTIAAVPLPPSK